MRVYEKLLSPINKVGQKPTHKIPFAYHFFWSMSNLFSIKNK